jgi:uncharacterized membrane protein YcaP (DUF421 family)
VAGKRELGQMTPFDLVVLLVISNAVQNAMVGPDTSLSSGIIAACTLVALNWIVMRLGLRSLWLRRHVVGSPTILIQDGRVLKQSLEAEGVDIDELLQACREHGIADIADAKLAMLEVDGTISVVPADPSDSGGASADGDPARRPTRRSNPRVHRTRRRIRARKPAG